MNVYEGSSEQTPRTIEVIGFGRRFVAYILDAVIIIGVQILLSFVVASATSAGGTDSAGAAGFSSLLYCLSILIGVGYFVVFWATSAQTPGKMMMGIKIIGVDGTPVSWEKAIVRYIGYIISSLILSLGFIWIAFDSKRQGWHDKIAGTYVVHQDVDFSSQEPVGFVPADSGSSAAIAIVLAVAVIFVVPVCIIAMLALLGPSISEVFSDIADALGTPAP